MSLSIQIESPQDGDNDSLNKSAGRWTQEEHNMFLLGLQTHQKQWKLIADMVKTRTVVQIRTHAQKYFQKLHKTNGWSKSDKLDDSTSPYMEQEGQRPYAYPAASTRADSFCSSADSVDSNGTSAEGVDSEGELIHGHRQHHNQQQQLGGHVSPRPHHLQPSGVYGYDTNASSGYTSGVNSSLSSPTGSGYNSFLAGQMQMQQQFKRVPPQPNVLKVKGELVRKRSRDSIKAMLPSAGEFRSSGGAPFSPKKGPYAEPHFVSSLKVRPDPDVHPSRAHSATSPSVSFRPNMFGAVAAANGAPHDGGYAGNLPGPLGGLPDDLGAGLGLGLDLTANDLYFPHGAFPDDPTCHFTSQLGCTSTDTDLYSYHASSSHNNSSCSLIEPVFDDVDLANILGTIDWDEPVPGHVDSASSTCTTTSRPLSPATDSASTVSTAPTYSSGSRAGAGAGGCTVPVTVGAAPLSPRKNTNTSSPQSNQGSLGVAELAVIGATTTSQSAQLEGDADAEAPVAKKHRVAFSNVIEELELVSQAVREISSGSSSSNNNTTSNGSGSSGSSNGVSRDADHISLFDLFQRDGTQAIGRLPPLSALVEQARARRASTGNNSNITTNYINNNNNIINHHSSDACVGPAVASETGGSSFSSAAPTTVAVASSNGAGAVNFDDHDFDFGTFLDDDDAPSVPMPMDCSAVPLPLFQQQQHFNASASTSAGGVGFNFVPNARKDSCGGDDLFTHGTGILDASGALHPGGGALLNINMMPSAPNSATNTPGGGGGLMQRKRGRPRKHSISGPSAPAGTSGAATAKSLLPAMTHSLNGAPFQQAHSLPDGQGYIVPVNAAVARAYNYAVSTAMASSAPADRGGYLSNYAHCLPPQMARSISGDSSVSSLPQIAPFRSYSYGGQNDPPQQQHFSSGNYFGADIRLGLTRTMSSESDTMMAAVFDHTDMGLGMLEDFE